jgi:hypothetical protein
LAVLVAAGLVGGYRNVVSWRGDDSRTTVTVPDSVLGLPRLTDSTSASLEQRVQDLPGPGDHVGGLYGDGSVMLVVGAARYPMGRSDRKDFLKAAAEEAKRQGVTLSKARPGSLGGTFECGHHATLPMTLCVFVDKGSYGIIAVAGPGSNATLTARGAREAFVHRA